MNLSAPLSVAHRIVMTLDGLQRAVAARRTLSVLVGRGTEVPAGWLIRLICLRVRRIETRILAMLAQFQAGRLRVAASPRAAVRTGRRGRGGGLKGVSRRFAWLLPLVPCEAANFAAQFRLTLAEPEMQALLAASAQARRLLQPLCRMLGIEPALLTPTRVEPGSAAEAAPRPVAAEPPDLALSWNLGVVRRPVADHGPPGDGGWRLAQAP